MMTPLFKKLFILAVPVMMCAGVSAKGHCDGKCDRPTPYEYSSNYFAYPYLEAEPPALTPAPEGYKPFHVEHYGRHGSRYLINASQYDRPIGQLEIAARNGRLTPLGERTLEHFRTMRDKARLRDGELSDIGAEQHKAITTRMARNFPEVFMTDAYIDGRSTIVIRCILSMLNGLDGLRTLNPRLHFKTDASYADMVYMNYDDSIASRYMKKAQKTALKEFAKRHPVGSGYLTRLFTDSAFVADSINVKTLQSGLFAVLTNDQSHQGREWLLEEVFSPDEIHALWLNRNANWYLRGGNTPLTRGMVPFMERNLLTNIIESADTAMVSPKISANLRYGHDTVLCPLAALMEIGNCGAVFDNLDDVAATWRDYRIIPMAANIQMIFYRPEGSLNPDDVLVKVLLNEHEMTLPVTTGSAPYYKWTDLRRYYTDKLASYPTR